MKNFLSVCKNVGGASREFHVPMIPHSTKIRKPKQHGLKIEICVFYGLFFCFLTFSMFFILCRLFVFSFGIIYCFSFFIFLFEV